MSKNLTLIIMASVILTLSSQASFLNIGIFNQPETSSTQTTVDALPGNVVNLWTGVFTDLDITGLQYETVMPTDGWTLTQREYSTFGWIEGTDDQGVDSSFPLVGGIGGGLAITSSTYNQTAANDFYFSSAQDCDSCTFPDGTVTGNFVVETFTLQLPDEIAEGIYDINLANIGAFDLNGNPFLDPFTSIQPSLGSFSVNVIPEPGTMALFTIALTSAFFFSRSRKKVAC